MQMPYFYIKMKNTFLDWFKQFWVMYYLEIQGLFKDFCHNSRTFQGFIQIQGLFKALCKFKDFSRLYANSRTFQYCMNPGNNSKIPATVHLLLTGCRIRWVLSLKSHCLSLPRLSHQWTVPVWHWWRTQQCRHHTHL